jgi:hypothetical protein
MRDNCVLSNLVPGDVLQEGDCAGHQVNVSPFADPMTMSK